MLHSILLWMHGHEVWLWWMGVLSILMFVATLAVIPMLVACMPADYFLHKSRIQDGMAVLVSKNIFGFVLIVLGLVMLVTPGQGILTIVLGLMYMNFPGKLLLERRIVSQPKVLYALNWMRSRAGKPPLEI